MPALTPILVNNGAAKIPCDGQVYRGWTTPLSNKIIVGAYLFGNLLTNPSSGADIVLWSPSYGGNYPPPYQDGPSSQWGAICDLHTFSQPAGHTGGRQGEFERWFPAGDGILVNDYVELIVIGWGGGTVEVYALIFVRDP